MTENNLNSENLDRKDAKLKVTGGIALGAGLIAAVIAIAKKGLSSL